MEAIGDAKLSKSYIKNMPREHKIANIIIHFQEKYLKKQYMYAVGVTRHRPLEPNERMISVRAPREMVAIAEMVLDKKADRSLSSYRIKKLNEIAKKWIKYE